MGTSDGFILDGPPIKIVDNGPDSERLVLVIISEGYQDTELDQFSLHSTEFVDLLQTTAPFGEFWHFINVYRIDIASTDSGANCPAGCIGCPPTGLNPSTFFDASFCYNGHHDLLTIADNNLPQSIADAKIGSHMWDSILIMVNSSDYGGSGTVDGAPVSVASVASGVYEMSRIAIHEIGHTLFSLTDEYFAFGTTYTGEPRAEANVAINIPDAINKWGPVINTSLSNLPCNCNCSTHPDCPPPNPSFSATYLTVGAFEGAHFNECNVFRSQQICRMQNIYEPFCGACLHRIRSMMLGITSSLPSASIFLTTSSIDFGSVPESRGNSGGIIVEKDIRFELTLYGSPMTLKIIENPSTTDLVPTGFSTPYGIETTVPANGTMESGALTIAYTSTSAGEFHNGQIFILAVEAGQVFIVDVLAETIPRPIAGIALVLDRSGSMSATANDGESKVSKLRSAASIFTSLLEEEESIGVITFNETATRAIDVTPAGPLSSPTGSGRANAQLLFEASNPALDPRGFTSIGNAIIKATQALTDARNNYDLQAILILTDGKENRPSWIRDVTNSITARTYAIGLGRATDINANSLIELSSNNHGYLLITGEINSDQSNQLSKFFLQILAGITNAEIVLDPTGYLLPNSQHRIPFSISSADYELDSILLTPDPKSIHFYLEAPDGTIIDMNSTTIGQSITFVTTNHVAFYRLSLPPLLGMKSEGRWHAIIERSDNHSKVKKAKERANVIPYDFVVHAQSRLKFQATLHQSHIEPEALVTLRADIIENHRVTPPHVSMWAEINAPHGKYSEKPLIPDDCGTFMVTFIASRVGEYKIRVRAQGRSISGSPFQREKLLTTIIVAGGNTSIACT